MESVINMFRSRTLPWRYRVSRNLTLRRLTRTTFLSSFISSIRQRNLVIDIVYILFYTVFPRLVWQVHFSTFCLMQSVWYCRVQQPTADRRIFALELNDIILNSWRCIYLFITKISQFLKLNVGKNNQSVSERGRYGLNWETHALFHSRVCFHSQRMSASNLSNYTHTVSSYYKFFVK